MNSLTKLFVYGTLKKGEPNHNWMQDGCEGTSYFLCQALTVEKYPLIVGSKYNVPFLLDAPGIGHNVKGELYNVDNLKLQHLDRLEEHPKFYVRELREVLCLFENNNNNETSNELNTSRNETVSCWIYLMKRFRKDLLKEQFLEVYSSNGDHERPYVDKSSRDPTYHAKVDIQDVPFT